MGHHMRLYLPRQHLHQEHQLHWMMMGILVLPLGLPVEQLLLQGQQRQGHFQERHP